MRIVAAGLALFALACGAAPSPSTPPHAGAATSQATASSTARSPDDDDVLPDALLLPEERRAWFDRHARRARPRRGPGTRIGQVDAFVVRGMLMLERLGPREVDAALARDVRAWLVGASSDFADAYWHHAAEVEAAPAGAPFRIAEAAWIAWVKSELPRMTLGERGALAASVFVIDFRKHEGERDRFAAYAFPGIDRMELGLSAIDAWIGAGHAAPPGGEDYVDRMVSPASLEIRDGVRRYVTRSRGEGDLYRWALADAERQRVLVDAVLWRNDEALAAALFANARRALRDEGAYLELLRPFEPFPRLWRIGVEVHAERVYRPSEALRAEARRWWLRLPHARPQAFFWFVRAVDGSYHPDDDFRALLQGSPADADTLDAYLDFGWEAFAALPVAWPGLERSPERIRVVTEHARPLLSVAPRRRPFDRTVAGTLAEVARSLCDEHATKDLAALRAFAKTELASHPDAGLSEVIDAADPSRCAPRRRLPPPPKAPQVLPSKKPFPPEPPKKPLPPAPPSNLPKYLPPPR